MRGTDLVHDLGLGAWAALAVARAAGRGRAGVLDAAAVAVNLAGGTPAALQRVREGRRDPVALAAPLAVGCAVVATARPRPRWAPVAAVSVLVVLRVAELRRAGFRRAGRAL